jgi:hypothetical protein
VAHVLVEVVVLGRVVSLMHFGVQMAPFFAMVALHAHVVPGEEAGFRVLGITFFHRKCERNLY